jgi:hypothetical protein
MRLGEEEQAGDPSLAGKDVPDGVAGRAQSEVLDHLPEHRGQDVAGAQGLRIAPVSIDHPFGSRGDRGHGA